jgi:hypothetical protein
MEVGRYSDVPRFSDSVDCFKSIKSWMDECSSQHENCPHNRISSLPSRLLDVRGDTIRLYNSRGHSGTYLTLSHCWGSGPNRIVTTSHNLKGHKQGIKWENLSRTYRDAISVTRRLGFQFIWIDSLCIVQDDPDEWELESGKMAQIYENSYITVCATHSKDGDGGLFNDRHRTSRHTKDIDLAAPWLADKTSGIYARFYYGYQFKALAKNNSTSGLSPLLTRAWTLQERVLAARTIDYMCDEIVWECRTRRRCECLEEDRNCRLLGIQRAIFNSAINLAGSSSGGGNTQACDPWESVVRAYSSLDLSVLR